MTGRRPMLTFGAQGATGEVAKLGDRLVGYAFADPGTRVKVAWQVTLGDWPRRRGGASNIDKARRQIERQVDEWCVSLGWIDPGAGVDVRVLTENDNERARA